MPQVPLKNVVLIQSMATSYLKWSWMGDKEHLMAIQAFNLIHAFIDIVFRFIEWVHTLWTFPFIG